ncbi:hypothetical protein CYY_007765 [Polysphondylium violaceum]|uniref:Uncharacterized protein n=1 Tax=Polysphondylium violaceum TaxID=133409 RepID=A0A8J4UQN5_9MYCE|nr:hypothetical protein CYY_007765 [Polysphondylium violaceum]
MVYPQKLEFNNPNHISLHLHKDVKYLGTANSYANQVLAETKTSPLNASITPTPVTIDDSTRIGMSNQTKAIYQSNNFNDLLKLQNEFQKDLQPLYEYISQNGYSAWQRLSYGQQSVFYSVWSNDALIWSYCYSIGSSNVGGVKAYQVYCKFGVQSTNTGTVSVQSFTIGVPYQFKNFSDGGLILARGLTPFFNRGLSFDYRKFALALTQGASSFLGNDFSFYTPKENIGLTVESLVFTTIFLGLKDTVDKSVHRTRVQLFNWDPNSKYMIVGEAFSNLLSAGQGDISALSIGMDKLTYQDYNPYVFPQFITLNPDVVAPYSVHVYHNHVNTNIDFSQLALQVSQIQYPVLPVTYGFSFAANLPQLGNHGQYVVGQSIDPVKFLKQAQDKFITKPLTITNYTDNGVPVTTNMVSTAQGVFNQLFDFRIHIGFNPASSKL